MAKERNRAANRIKSNPLFARNACLLHWKNTYPFFQFFFANIIFGVASAIGENTEVEAMYHCTVQNVFPPLSLFL